ncbi:MULTISPECIES: hypothetical protein [unclassified Bradyrhizobium]|uniref:hypothetical protein n=1 Tax=unclassified Bradyrhizobium TaxID=2631580 RepID=UPI001BAD1C17|nr:MULTISPECIES: hypothetical protein [unclassified Bradyrhizobium]MBR1206618.1 hypothetical protein [Bradyrhizobium sp. AUGA SZCCT0124]MBR1338534.1 hypothetical protein [Bradyrhizobium sp. AUGA SZCCT0105]MBR1356189.1 hypothetical protein [Bradyrhizobium sp. AUGA SZCCT0045]
MPFSFAGPGSNVVNPSQIVAPPPAAAPVAAATPTDASSRNRAPDDYIPVGNYQMPAFRGGAPAPAAAEDDEEAAPAAPAARAPVTGAPASAPFSLAGAGGGFSDRLMKATRGFLGNLSSGPIGALAGGAGALITGQETDPSAIAQGKLNATGQALLAKGASVPEVRAALGNPAVMKALIDQYYGKDKWSVVKVGKDADGNETFMQQNQVDGTLRPLPAGTAPVASSPPGTVTGPDGKAVAIPPGVDRKTFIKRVSESAADAATGKQTEAQAKSAAFAARMEKAQAELDKLQNEGLSATQAISSSVPFVGNYLQSANHQQYETAKSAFISAKLRAESGAAISPSEYTREEKELFPQPGDTPARVQQKQQLRAAALAEMKRSAGPGYAARPASAKPAGSINVGGQAINWSVN